MQKKNEPQEYLFEMVRKQMPKNTNLAEKTAEILKIGVDAAYRKIRGESKVTLQEALTLCRFYGISFDEMLYGINKMQYAFVPFELQGMKNYLLFTKELAAIMKELATAPGCEIRMTAADIPVFHFIAFRELSFFQLFSWHKTMYSFDGNYEDFVGEIDAPEILELYQQIHRNYQLIPSTEIWTGHTLDSILKLLKYHSDMRHFNDSHIPSLICDQILMVMKKLEDRIDGGKENRYDIPYNFYVNDTDVGNTFIYIKNKGISNCILRLFSINGLHIKDEVFCREVELWLNSLIRRSHLISGSSSRERFKFLTEQKKYLILWKRFNQVVERRGTRSATVRELLVDALKCRKRKLTASGLLKRRNSDKREVNARV